MKKILYASLIQPDVEISYPNYLEPTMNAIWHSLKIKVVSRTRVNGKKLNNVVFDEIINLK